MTPPADIGNGIACASFASDGSWLSVGTTDRDLGFVELSGLPPFDETQRGHVPAVRQYRALMSDPRHAVLTVTGATAIGRVAIPGGRTICQNYAIPAETTETVVVRFCGRLDRPAYAEVTDVSPLEPLMLAPSLVASGHRLLIATGRAGLTAEVEVRVPAEPRGAWTVTGDTTAEFGFDAATDESLRARTFVVACTLGDRGTFGREPSIHRPAPVPASASWLSVPRQRRHDVARVANGALRYTLDCTTLDVGDGESTILTDHRILPLSWTRDAYYQALAVLQGVSGYGAEAPAISRIAAHLRWLWRRCDRPGGAWQRSYQANGTVKDWAVQADQQLYPVLELLDYRDINGTWPAGLDDWGERTRSVWSALPRDQVTGLLTSQENPADDDASDLPLLLSTQLLFWHTARRLAVRAAELGVSDLGLDATADAVRSSTLERFTADGPFGRQWLYAIDGHGGGRRYHDANDIPVALAPCYGFVGADDPVWDATMRFALSSENPAFAAGPMGGLGSAHTPGVWPLGDVQEWLWASMRGDEQRVDATVARLAAVANTDGLLPETYDPASGAWLSRPWFAWPGSAVAALVNGAFR